jgi:uncharacterized protein YggE
MRSLWLGILLAAVESLAFGQLESDTLTVSVSQSVNLQPDQAVFAIPLITAASTSLDEVVASLKGAGITAANLSSVGLLREHTLYLIFTVAVPFSKIPSTAAQLTAQKIAFYVQGSQVSPALQQAQQCPITNLMTDAKAQAKRVADAAELVAGDVLALSGGSPSISGLPIPVPTAVVRDNLDPTLIGTVQIPATAPLVLIQPAVRATCSLVVKFKLLRYR